MTLMRSDIGAKSGIEELGQLREAVSAVRNLDQLAHSRHVGPRAIAAVLPEVRRDCEHLEALTQRVLRQLAPFNPNATQCLLEDVARAKASLATAVRIPDGKLAYARHRLMLQDAARVSVSHLDGLLGMLNLLAAASRNVATPLRPTDLSLPEGTAGEVDECTADFGAAEVNSSPAAATQLMAALLCMLGSVPRHVRATLEQGHWVFRFRRSATPGAPYRFRRIVMGRCSQVCTEAAASLLGCKLQVRPDGSDLMWSSQRLSDG